MKKIRTPVRVVEEPPVMTQNQINHELHINILATSVHVQLVVQKKLEEAPTQRNRTKQSNFEGISQID